MPLLSTFGGASVFGFRGGGDLYPQLVNYLMLYDGSLGQSGSGGSNVMSAVTGGYTQLSQNTSFPGTFTYNTSNLYRQVDAADGRDGGWQTTNTINLTGYNSFYVDGEGAHDPSTAYGPACLNMFYTTNTATSGNTILSGATQLVVAPTNQFYLPRGVLSANISTVNSSQRILLWSQSGYTGGSNRWDSVYTMWIAKSDAWQTWMALGGVSGFATLDSLLSNATAMATLMNSANALEFMVKQCTGTVMSGVIKNAVALNALNSSSTAVAKCAGNVHWSKFLNLGINIKYSSGTFNGTQNAYTDLIYTDTVWGGNKQTKLTSKYAAYTGNWANGRNALENAITAIPYATGRLNTVSDAATGKQFILSGTNNYNFATNAVAGKWVSVFMQGGAMTAGMVLGNFKVIVGGTAYTMAQAISNGYIEPLVLTNSSAYSSSYVFPNFENILTGNTGTGYYTQGVIFFKPKTTVTGIQFYSNINYYAGYGDGLYVWQLDNSDLSLVPF